MNFLQLLPQHFLSIDLPGTVCPGLTLLKVSETNNILLWLWGLIPCELAFISQGLTPLHTWMDEEQDKNKTKQNETPHTIAWHHLGGMKSDAYLDWIAACSTVHTKNPLLLLTNLLIRRWDSLSIRKTNWGTSFKDKAIEKCAAVW